MPSWKSLAETRSGKSSATTKATWHRSSISNPLAENSAANIALTGFMAVGKSAVGRTLARKLGRRFVDLDKIIEKSEGMKVKDIFSRKGERHFRRAEKQAIVEDLFQEEQEIARGGGIVKEEEDYS